MINERKIPSGFKESHAGIIPNDWENFLMQEISEVTRLAGYEYSEYWEESEVGEILALKGENIGRNEVIEKNLSYISDELSLKLKRSRLYINDIVFPCVGTIGNALVVKENNKYHINQNIAKISPNKKYVDSYYLAQYLMSDYCKNEIRRFNATTSQPNVLVGSLRRFRLSLPPLHEQTAIANLLNTWDKAIQTTTLLIEQKQNRKKWLMQMLLSGKKRLKGFEKLKWGKKSIGECIIESRVPSIKNDPNMRITVRLNLKGIEKRGVKGTESEDATAYFIRKKGQFIYGKQNLHKGAFGIIPAELNNFESSQDIPAFDFTDLIFPEYFMYFMSQEMFYTSLEKISTGTGSKRIHPEELYKVKIPYPSIKEQIEIAKLIEYSTREINLLAMKANHLMEQKKGLMQVLLTGKKRLKVN